MRTQEELVQALSWMEEQGLVEELEAADGRLRYRRRGPDAMFQAMIATYCDPPATRH